MSNEWYCRIMGDELGPMSPDELLTVARWGRLSRDDVVKNGPNGTWVRAEIVEGLFEDSITQPTAGPRRPLRQPQPAKRSVKSGQGDRYWVNLGNRIEGPFSSEQLCKFVRQGQLSPNHAVSGDRFRWIPASQIKGLPFGEVDRQAATLAGDSVPAISAEAKPHSARVRRNESRHRAIELTKSVACGS
jgi:hypothetical protein